MIHHVFANRSNIGDWLSAKGIQRLLAPCEVREYLCDEPFVDGTLAALSALPRGELVVVGGGGLLMDYFAPFWNGLDQLRRQLEICLWGVGYCDLKNEMSHPPLEVVKRIAKSARLCVVRDELTRSYLELPEWPRPVACPSMGVIGNLPRGRALLHVDNYTTAGADTYEAMDEACRRYAAFENRPYLKTNNRIERADETEMQKTMSLYERSDFVVSSALHRCVIAAAMGRPVVAVSGDRKIDAFMSMAGLGDWVLDVEEVDRLPDLLEKLPTQALPWRFVDDMRSNNKGVGRRVKQLAGAVGEQYEGRAAWQR